MDKNKLFVVFSATPLKMGSFIRTATGERYNHVSLSLSPKFNKMYSFARRHKNTPFYGGFVCETPARYRHKGKVAEVFVCALPVTDDKYTELENLFLDMEKKREQYFYNLFSAALAPISRRFPVRNSFTCAEFAVFVISKIYSGLDADKFYSVDDLRQKLEEFSVYFGPFPNIKECESDLSYEQKIPFHKNIRLTFGSGKNLVKASLNRKNR